MFIDLPDLVSSWYAKAESTSNLEIKVIEAAFFKKMGSKCCFVGVYLQTHPKVCRSLQIRLILCIQLKPLHFQLKDMIKGFLFIEPALFSLSFSHTTLSLSLYVCISDGIRVLLTSDEVSQQHLQGNHLAVVKMRAVHLAFMCVFEDQQGNEMWDLAFLLFFIFFIFLCTHHNGNNSHPSKPATECSLAIQFPCLVSDYIKTPVPLLTMSLFFVFFCLAVWE